MKPHDMQPHASPGGSRYVQNNQFSPLKKYPL